MVKVPHRPSSATPAIAALVRAGVDFTEHSYHHDSSVRDFGAEAARALGVPADDLCKTLVCQGAGDHDLLVAIVPVSHRLDLKSLARHTGHKRLTMAEPSLAQRVTGYQVGGISPFGQRSALPTVLDRSAAENQWVYVSGGRRGLDVRVRVADLIAVLDASVAPIAR